MPTPRQVFEENLGPAQLMLKIYRLLDGGDPVLTEGELVEALRSVIQAEDTEYLMVVHHELFTGLVRQRAHMSPPDLQRATLEHLLRQSVATSCTALETFLPALLSLHLPTAIRVLGRNFLPRNDNVILEYFKEMTFSLDEALRLLENPDAGPEYISQKIIGLLGFKYLTGKKGVHVSGRLLGIEKPWDRICNHLQRDAEKKELMETLDKTLTRRNDIVHRSDRSQDTPNGDRQAITYIFAKQAADTIEHVCLALDDVVQKQVDEYQKALKPG